MAEKRRLPVLPASELPPEDEERPPWHWSAVATVGTFVFWLPLILGVDALTRGPSASWVALNAAAFALANGASGFLVGRFGGKAGKREATVGGVAAGAVAWTVAVTQGAAGGAVVWALVLVAVVALAGGAARAGGALGVARREKPRA